MVAGIHVSSTSTIRRTFNQSPPSITFQILLVFLYPLVIQPLFNKLTPLEPGELRDRIEALAGYLKFPLKHLYQIDGSKRSSHSNAYFFGLPWSKHIVVYDTLIATAKVDGVEAILAHELGLVQGTFD